MYNINVVCILNEISFLSKENENLQKWMTLQCSVLNKMTKISSFSVLYECTHVCIQMGINGSKKYAKT